MSLRGLTIQELLALARDARKSFEERNRKWADRRRVRFRQMDCELEALPLSERADKPLMIWQTEEPNQEAHRRTKRLIANRPRIECVVYDDTDPAKAAGQEVEDGHRALWEHLNSNKSDPPEILAVEYQQGDGCGIFKLDLDVSYADAYLKDYVPEDLEAEDGESDSPSQKEARAKYHKAKDKYKDDSEASAKAYRDITEEVRRRIPPPIELTAPDPLSCAWWTDHDRIRLVVEQGRKPLNPLLDTLKDKGVRLVGKPDAPKLKLYEGSDVAGGMTIPENIMVPGGDFNTIEYLEIRTPEEIAVIYKSPHVKNRTLFNLQEGDGIVLVYDNPFGPEYTGYSLLPGDVSTSPEPADHYQPPILGTLNVAQPLNVLGTIRLSAAIETALRHPYIKADDSIAPSPLTQAEGNKTATMEDGIPVPVIPGEVKLPEAANIDLDKAELRFAVTEAQNRFAEVLSGDATSADSGHKLAIQVSQADTQMVPYQNARARATAEVLRACEAAVTKLGVPIYIKSKLATAKTTAEPGARVGGVRKLDPEKLGVDHDIMVTIGSETPLTKFAKWAAMTQRYKDGGLSFETWIEESDVENPQQEIARIFEGMTLQRVMQEVIPLAVRMAMARAMAKLTPPAPPTAGEGIPPESGLANGGGENPTASGLIAGMGKAPGLGLPEGGPFTREYGPPIEEGAGDVGGSTGGAV